MKMDIWQGMIDTYLVTIVPPVARANKKRNTQNNQNHGTKAAPTPATNCSNTAITNGLRRPYLQYNKHEFVMSLNRTAIISIFNTHLSAIEPNKMLPTRMPNMNMVCDKLAN